MKKSIVILSGGADSTICAAIAQQTTVPYAITFDYGQRHRIELKAACNVAQALDIHHKIIRCSDVLVSTSPLTSSSEVEQYSSANELPDGIASTFVPARNLLFLTIALNRAVAIGATEIYTGVCQTDYSGYPDCRRSFINSFEQTANQALEQEIRVITPLMNLTKAESVLLAQQVMRDRFDEIMGLTHSCYQGVIGGCGHCAACLLRERGFQEAGIEDPAKLRDPAGKAMANF